jgi:hypothetical protein
MGRQALHRLERRRQVREAQRLEAGKGVAEARSHVSIHRRQRGTSVGLIEPDIGAPDELGPFIDFTSFSGRRVRAARP